MNPTNYHNGRLARFCARLWLRCKGYRIIAVNYKTGRGTKAGEIDFIACRGKTLVFAEVKNAERLIMPLIHSSGPAKKNVRGAEAFLQKYPQYRDYRMRFDAVLVSFPLRIRHIENAWTSW